MLRGQMELPSEMLGLAVSEGIVVLTEEEFEALEARKPVTMPEEFAPVVCFDGEVWGVSLAGPNPEARHFITCACEGDARGLHAALEARKPQVSAGVIERAREALNALLDPTMVLLKHHVCALDALLAAVEAAPPDEERLTEEDVARFAPVVEQCIAFFGNEDALRYEDVDAQIVTDLEQLLHHLRPDAPTPDFASMSADDLRAWLDERGRRDLCELDNDTWTAILWDRGSVYEIANVYGHPTERAALLALCQKVAAKEAS